MIGFEYTYNSPTEIFNNITHMSDYSPLEFFILFILVCFFIGLLHYGLPILDLYKNYRQQTKKKNERAKFIKQIVLQKDIEAEIEKELEI